jgi:hypothetical protein
MHLKTSYKMRRKDWLELVEAAGGTTMGSRHRTDARFKIGSLPAAVRLPGKPTRGGFKFSGGRLTRTAGRGK